MVDQKVDPATQIDEIKHSILTDDEAAKHRLIDDGAPSSTKLWSSEKINSEITVNGGLTPTALKSDEYTLVAGDRAPYTPTTFTGDKRFTFPASPSNGDTVGIKNVTADTDVINAYSAAHKIEDPISGGLVNAATDLPIGVAWADIIWQYMASASGNAWHVVGG